MEYDKTKLARLELDASAAQAAAEHLRDALTEARQLESMPTFHLRRMATGFGKKYRHLEGLLSDLPALVAAANEAGAHEIARQAQIVLERRTRVAELELAVTEAQRRYHALSATARRCREFVANIGGTAQPYRPPALAPRY